MKTHIMFRRSLTALAFAAALAVPPGPAQAQTNDAPKPRQAEASSASIRGNQYYDLEIENGRLAGNVDEQLRNYAPDLGVIVKILRSKHPEANIAMSPELSDVMISDLKLHAASVGEELEAVRIASGGKFTWKATQMSPDSMSPLFTLEPSGKFLHESAETRGSQVQVFNFSSYFARRRDSGMDDAKFQALKEQTIRSTKQIVATTVASLNIASPLDFQFHEGANLLVVSGRPEAIGIAGIVINAMLENPRGGSNPDINQARQLDNQFPQMAEEVARLKAERTLLLEKLNALEKAASTNKPKPQF